MLVLLTTSLTSIVLLSTKATHHGEWKYYLSWVDKDGEQEIYFWVGISMMLVGNTLSALGLLVQKHAHKTQEEAAGLEGKEVTWTSYITSPIWLCGFGIFLLGHISCWISLALAPQAVLACLTCWSTVVTFVVAPIFLDETVTVFRLMSVCVMIFGCSWVIMSGPRVYRVFTVDILLTGLGNIIFQVLTGLALLYLICCAGMALMSKSSPRLSAFQYVSVAAIIGWYSVLSAKVTSGLVFSTWHHAQNQFDRWESWVMMVTMVVLAVSNLHFINMALSVGDAVYVVPVYEAMSILGQTLLGGIFFNEFQHLSTFGLINFCLGLSCILLGIFFLARKGPDTEVWQYPVISPRRSPSPSAAGSVVDQTSPARTPPVTPPASLAPAPKAHVVGTRPPNRLLPANV